MTVDRTCPNLLLISASPNTDRYLGCLRQHYAINTVSTGEAALASARIAPPDLILCESYAAKLNGLRLLSELRADPQLQGLPVLLIAAEHEDVGKAGEHHIRPEDYLVMPVSDHELVARVSMHLQIAALRRQTAEVLRASEAHLEAEAKALMTLNDATFRLWHAQDMRSGFAEMLAATLELVKADMALVKVLDPQTGKPRFAYHGIEPDAIDTLHVLLADERSAAGRALRTFKRVVIEDVEADPIYAPLRHIARAAGFRAVFSVPLIGRDAMPLGILSAHFRSVHRPSEQDIRRFDLYARQAADFLERCRIDEALRESERRFRATFENAAVGIAHVAPDGSLLRVNDRLCEIVGWSADELATKTFQGITHPDDLASNLERFERALSGNADHYAMEKRYLRKDGSIVWANLTVGCVRKPNGTIDYFISVIEDITERKLAEEHARLLLREVNHRSKNLLAVVQAVARQTAEDSDPKLFAQRFAARLSGLAACQDLLVKNDWREVDVGDLVRTQLSHFAGLIGSRICPSGPPLKLSPTAAQTIGMALHELATNAGKYGALSVENGVIEVGWGLTSTDEQSRFSMRWLERGSPPVDEPIRKGFGHTVMVRMVEYDLGADVKLEFGADGLVWHMTAPAHLVLSNQDLRLAATEGVN